MVIDIRGIDKARLLCALYNRSIPKNLRRLQFANLQVEDARAILGKQTRFDYLDGRVLKVDLSGDSFDPWLYDRDNGDGAAEEAVVSVLLGVF
jgi:hypothetical protein